MTVKLEAAFHEAGHAVMAHQSRFHAIVGPVDLEQYGAGQIFVSLSKNKLNAAGKPIGPEAQKDKEVAKDLASVLCAGLVAEQIAASHNPVIAPNPTCAQPDHELARQQLSAAGLSKRFDSFETDAKDVLTKNWPLVESLAQFLFQKCSVDAVDIVQFIAAQQSVAADRREDAPPAER